MKLLSERNLNYKVIRKKIASNYKLLTIEFEAIDSSEIHVEMVFGEKQHKGIILEIPDYQEGPSTVLELMKYSALGYISGCMHVRGDRGRSTNKQPTSIYFPFLTNNQGGELYYNYAYQDTIDLVNILIKEFPNQEVNIIAKGQGAALGIVASAVGGKVDSLFISEVQNFDFNYIFENNLDIDVYAGIREYARNYTEKEEYLLARLGEIDILNYLIDLEAEVCFAYSKLDDEKYIFVNEKLEKLFKRKIVEIFECERGDLHKIVAGNWLLNECVDS